MALSLVGRELWPPAIGDFELETEEDFFRGGQAHVAPLSVLDVTAAGVGVHAKFGIDQIAVILDEEVDAIRRTAFFIRGQGEDQVARWAESFALHAQKGDD